jgi:hypothetical protein
MAATSASLAVLGRNAPNFLCTRCIATGGVVDAGKTSKFERRVKERSMRGGEKAMLGEGLSSKVMLKCQGNLGGE